MFLASWRFLSIVFRVRIFALVWAALSAWFSAVPAIGAVMVAEYTLRLCGAGPASRAIIVEPVPAIKPSRRQLGMTNAAPADEGELDGL